MIAIEQKKAKSYVTPRNAFEAKVIDVDLSRRNVTAIGNTYNFIDYDMDMLIMGCSARSISERGPQSEAKAKMKHLKDHIMRTDYIAGKFLNVEETTFEGRQVLKFESQISDAKILELYQDGTLDQHSIGFRYVDLGLAYRDSMNEDERNRYSEFIGRAINPQVAEDAGYFWVVKEIELFEISTVVFGSNSQTSVTDIKDKNPKTQKTILNTYLDSMRRHFDMNKGKLTPDDYRMAQLNIKQFQQAINDLESPSLKGNAPVKDISKDREPSELLSLINF